MKDWRTDISGHDSLYDLDPAQVMIQFRHQYLSSAKDLMFDDPSFSDNFCMVAEHLQAAIELQLSENYLIHLEPA